MERATTQLGEHKQVEEVHRPEHYEDQSHFAAKDLQGGLGIDCLVPIFQS